MNFRDKEFSFVNASSDEKIDEYTKTTKYVKDIDYEENQYELENDGFRSTNTSSLDFFDDLNEW